MKTEEFQELVWQSAVHNSRTMPWRPPSLELRNDNTLDPYSILVSEIMLQQTQVERVSPKFEMFIRRFPSFQSLANAPLSDVLVLWSGLGYNRRAKFLWLAANKIMTDFGGVFPSNYKELITLPGVGANTAGAILAYAFNRPVVFIETNIRSVYLHHFFAEDPQVSDQQLAEYISATLDQEHPREWYYALMDYGTQLKKSGVANLNQSAHYKKQSSLKGSLREMRGHIIKALAEATLSEMQLKAIVKADERYEPALKALLKEQLIKKTKTGYCLA